MASPKKAARRYDHLAAGSSSSVASSSSSSSSPFHNPFNQPPSLLPPEPSERPVPSHTNLETSIQSKGPPPWPTITYKHVLSAGTLNPTNPLRVIAHCDVDAAYAQFEASRLGLDATVVPIAVQQWQGLIAVNYPARDAGVSRFESIPEALKKCPDLHLVHVATYAHGSDKAEYHVDPKPETHKVSLDPYRRESNKILAIFKKTCPAGAVEKASIDESYFDLTIEVRKLMIERFPFLKDVPKDDPKTGKKGMDHPLPPPPRLGLKQWKQVGYVIPKSGDVGKATGIGRPEKSIAKGALLVDAPIGAGYVSEMPTASPQQQPGTEAPTGTETEGDNAKAKQDPPSWGSEDRLTDPTSSQQAELEAEEALWDQIEYGETTWTDIALALGAELMNRVRQNVVDELGYTTSAGIASNKTLSKLCSSWHKPNGQTIMRPCSISNFFSSLPFQKIRFLGGKLGTAMGQEWNSATVSDLWDVSLDEMQAKFGEEARWVFNVLRGIDHSEVRERVNNQTMLASKSVRPPITTMEEALHWLTILATELAIRLMENRKLRHNLWPKTLVLRYIRAGSVPRSRQTSFPFTNPTNQQDLANVILKKGQKLWKDSLGDALGLGAISTNSTASGSSSSIGGMDSGSGKVLTIALGFSGLEEGEMGQRGIERFLGGSTVTDTTKTIASPADTAYGDGIGTISNAETNDARSSNLQATSAAASPATASLPSVDKKRKRSRLDEMFEQSQQRNRQDRESEGLGEADLQRRPGRDSSITVIGGKIDDEFGREVPGSESSEQTRVSGRQDPLDDVRVPLPSGDLVDERQQREDQKKAENEQAGPIAVTGSGSSDEPYVWRCAECGEVIRPPVGAASFEAPYLFQKAKEEHLDWHFAVSLSQQQQQPQHKTNFATSSSSSSRLGVGKVAMTNGKKNQKRKPGRLETFFAKKKNPSQQPHQQPPSSSSS